MIFVDIGGIVDHHSMTWIEGWFLLILVVELLTNTQWVEVRGDVCWYWWNCWPSLNEFRWEMIFVDIGGIVDHHSMSWSERWFLLILVKLLTSLNELRWEVIFLILVELFTITQWVKMRGDFCWYWWKWLPSLNEFRWEVIFVDIGGIVDITQWVDVRGDSCWYWWNFDHHSMSLGERWFLLILVELLTIIQWVWLRGDFCWYWLNWWPSLNELRWEVIFIDIGEIVDYHWMS
jgi:hypothetical protein